MLTSIDVKFIFDSTRLSSGKPIEHFLVDDQFEFRHFIFYIYIYIYIYIQHQRGKVSLRKSLVQSARQYDVMSRVRDFQNGEQSVHRGDR